MMQFPTRIDAPPLPAMGMDEYVAAIAWLVGSMDPGQIEARKAFEERIDVRFRFVDAGSGGGEKKGAKTIDADLRG